MRSGREPTWRLVLLGWLLGQGLLEGSSSGPRFDGIERLPFPYGPATGRPGPASGRPGGPAAPLTAGWGPDLHARELRAWPGIGEARAVEVARARWAHPNDGPPLYLDDVPGIGSGTARAARTWLDRGGPPRPRGP